MVLADAFRDEVFVGRYERDARPLSPPSRERPEAALRGLPEDSVLTGGRCTAVRGPRARSRFRAPVSSSGMPFLAGMLGRLAEPLLEAGGGVSAADLRPLYLREADVRPSRP